MHGVGVLAGGTVEWMVVCRRLECWLEEMLLHRSWSFQERCHKTAPTLLGHWCLYAAASPGRIRVRVRVRVRLTPQP